MPVLIWVPPKDDPDPRILGYKRGGSRKHSEGRGIETGRGGRPIKGAIMSRLPMWATGAQSYWCLSRTLCDTPLRTVPVKGEEAGVFIQLSLNSVLVNQLSGRTKDATIYTVCQLPQYKYSHCG